MAIFLTILFFCFGLIIGSFLNVVIFRHNTGRFLGSRSACIVCRSQLRFYELIPVLSFLALRGRCRSCKTKISIQYPLVEIVSGLIFVGLFLKFQDVFWGNIWIFIATYTYFATLFSILIVIAVYDLKHKIIPDILSLTFGVLTFVGLFLFLNINSFPSLYLNFPSIPSFLSGPLMAAPFALLWLISRGRWMGLGDAKLALGLGWLLGPLGAACTIIIAFWSGAIVGVILLLISKNYKMKSEIPFAPYLILGSLLVFLFDVHFFYF